MGPVLFFAEEEGDTLCWGWDTAKLHLPRPVILHAGREQQQQQQARGKVESSTTDTSLVLHLGTL